MVNASSSSFFFLLLFFLSLASSRPASTSLPADANASKKIVGEVSVIKEALNNVFFEGRKMGANEHTFVRKSLYDQENSAVMKVVDTIRGSKFEAVSEETNAILHKAKTKKKAKMNDADSFVAYADYRGPHHHPPKNN